MRDARGQAVPLTGCDCFHLALDRMMQESGQGPNVALVVLELAGPIPVGTLRSAVARLSTEFPIVDARVRRRFPIGVPSWRLPLQPRPPVVFFWREPGARTTVDEKALRQVGEADEVVGLRLGVGPSDDANLVLDEIRRADGSTTLLITWRHVLLDAKGGELLVRVLDGLGQESVPRSRFVETAPETLSSEKDSLHERLVGMRTVGRRLDALRAVPFRSLGGPDARPSTPCFRVVTLDDKAARTSIARAEEHSGAFAQMAFFLATAVRAHHAVFRARNADPGAFVVSIPVQTRRRNESGPVFQNHLSILFFGLPTDEVSDLGQLTRKIRSQLAEMMRGRLDQRWADGLRLARCVPSSILMRVMRRRFGGEIASFFHSFTGSFANDIESFLGIRVANAYHVPTVALPPGTGLFVGQHGTRLNVTLSWRREALSDDEADVLLESVQNDLLGVSDDSVSEPRRVGDRR